MGFSLVVGLLGSQSPATGREARRILSIRDVAEGGLVATGGAFLPLAIHAYGATVITTWRLASAAFLLLMGLHMASSIWRRRGVAREGIRAEPVRSAIFTLLTTSGPALLLINALHGGDASGARYLTSVMIVLAVVGLLFIYATFSNTPHRPAV